MKTTSRASSRSLPPLTAITVAGIMSGTSADGIDVAIVRITPPANSARNASAAHLPHLRLLSHFAVSWPPAVRRRILQAMNAPAESVPELARLHWRLGELYADAVTAALKAHPAHLDLIGCHGQTIYHQGAPQRALGAVFPCTWQMGEASVIAAQTGVPVVSDFRPADLALGGQGAPLVPLLDFVAFHHAKRNRVLQNLGGIGNLTVVPANAAIEDVIAFDTGPANMVIDAIVGECFGKKYDARGSIAAHGRVLDSVVQKFLAQRFFLEPPPKSAGREEFGGEFSARFLAECRKQSPHPEDAVATATAFTAASIGLAWNSFVQPALADATTDYILAGGGAKNPTLVRMIRQNLAPLPRIAISSSDDFGIPTAAKEAMAFALLAYQTWHRLPGNLPAATGASRPAILGRITYA